MLSRRSSCLLIFTFVVSFFVVPEFSRAQKAKTHVLSADEAKEVKKDAASLFATTDYKGALKAYLDLYQTDKENPEINFRIGYCYLQTNSKKLALPYLEKANQAKEPRKEGQFYMGLAYMYNARWDEAIQAFTNYKDASHNKLVKDFLAPDRYIEMCMNGKELSAHPVNVQFTNLGKSVNSMYEDYNPFISADGKSLLFTTRRKGNVGGFIEDLGIFTADIYSTQWRDTLWTKAKSLGGLVNGEWDEEAVGVTAAGDQVFIYFDNADNFADIGVASIKGKTWQKPVMLPEKINSKQYEGGACISLDGSTLYFSSNRKDGVGGNDIWISHRFENGDWEMPVNAGKNINTKFDEESPFLTMDGKILYFSSKGHNSMGGYDIFRSTWDEKNKTWGEAVNVGFPINDAEDNAFFSMTGDGRTAYLSAVRDSGIGDRDIYQVTFNDTIDHPFLALISGTVASATGSGRIELSKVTLENKDTRENLVYRPAVPSNYFVLCGRPGHYRLRVEGYNFAEYSEDIEIPAGFPPAPLTRAIQVKLSK